MEKIDNQELNFDLLMDIPLKATVELGATKLSLQEILHLKPGSVLDINRYIGEPVDLLVNGKLLAKGEVVVIDDNLGFKITDIISKPTN